MAEEETVQEANEAAHEAAVSSRDFDAEAREMGWVPEAEFKGPKDKWKPAQQFVEDGEKILPIVRSQLNREREERKREKEEFAKRLERIERMSGENLKRAQEQHKAEVERIRAEMRKAVSEGDEATFDRLERQKDQLEKAAPKADAPVDPNADLATRQEAWRAKNTWFDEDFEMQDFAIRYSDFHGRRNPHLSFEENMKAVEAEVRRKFPERFGEKRPAANGHAAVDGGGSFSAPARKDGLFAKLPAEAREQAKKDVAAGLYKDTEAWAKVYLQR